MSAAPSAGTQRSETGEATPADGEARQALTRVLAREGRNAVARVELAASELARLEAPPAMRQRLDAIRSAVAEIDGLLGKIDLLACGPPALRSDLVDLRAVWQGVRQRLAPALAARDVRLEPHVDGPELRVRLSESVLEAILIAFLRLRLADTDVDAANAGDARRHVLRARAIGDRVRLAWTSDGWQRVATADADPGGDVDGEADAHADDRDAGTTRRDGPALAEARVELELLLAEWGGTLDPAHARAAGPRVWLPGERSDG